MPRFIVFYTNDHLNRTPTLIAFFPLIGDCSCLLALNMIKKLNITGKRTEILTRLTEWPPFCVFLWLHSWRLTQGTALPFHMYFPVEAFFPSHRCIQTPNFIFIKTVMEHLQDGKTLWVQSVWVSQTISYCRMIPISKHPRNRLPPQGCWLPVTVLFSGRLLENYNSGLWGPPSDKYLFNTTKSIYTWIIKNRWE